MSPKCFYPLCVLLAVVSVASVVASQQTPRSEIRSHTVELTLGAQNMQNFFDAFDDAYTWDEKAWPKPSRQTRPLGEQMKAMDADFFAVSEIENVGILTRFRDWNFAGEGYDYIWTNYMQGQRGINVGFLSRVPVGSITLHKFDVLTLPDQRKRWFFARDLVRVELNPAEDVSVFVYPVHFKSKRDSENDPNSNKWRLAEATAVAKQIRKQLEVDPGAYIAVAGDFNDTPGSPPLQVLHDAGLVDPHKGLPEEQRITYLKKPYRSTVDYILVSKALAAHRVEGSAKVYGTDAKEAGTDHAGLTVRFKLPTAQEDARATWTNPFPIDPVRTMLDREKQESN